jgi:hypothetical protein
MLTVCSSHQPLVGDLSQAIDLWEKGGASAGDPTPGDVSVCALSMRIGEALLEAAQPLPGEPAWVAGPERAVVKEGLLAQWIAG